MSVRQVDGGGSVPGGAYLSPTERRHLQATEEQIKTAKTSARKVLSANKDIVAAAGNAAAQVSGANNANHLFIPKAGTIADCDAVVGQLTSASFVSVAEKQKYDAASEADKRAMAKDFITRAQKEIETSLQALAPEEMDKIKSQYNVRNFADGQWGNASQAALTALIAQGVAIRDSERVPGPTDGVDDPVTTTTDEGSSGESVVTEADKYFVAKNNGRQGVVMIEPARLAELQRLRASVEGGTATEAQQELWSQVQKKASDMHVGRFDEKTTPTPEQVADTFFTSEYDTSQSKPVFSTNPARQAELERLRERCSHRGAKPEEIALWNAIVKRGEALGVTVKPERAQPAEPTTAISAEDRAWLQENFGPVDSAMGIYNAKPNALSGNDLTAAIAMLEHPEGATNLPAGATGTQAFRNVINGMSETDKSKLLSVLKDMQADFPEHILGNDGAEIEYWDGDKNQPLATRDQVERYLDGVVTA